MSFVIRNIKNRSANQTVLQNPGRERRKGGGEAMLGPGRNEVKLKYAPLSELKLVFSSYAFYIWGFQVSFLLNECSEFQSHWIRHDKKEQRLWK